MRRHTEVGKQSVYMFHTVIAHPVLEIAEIAPHESETASGVRDVAFGVGVLVEAEQPAALAEAREYLSRMAATAERHVHIRAVRAYGESVHALLQQHRHMICARHNGLAVLICYLSYCFHLY